MPPRPRAEPVVCVPCPLWSIGVEEWFHGSYQESSPPRKPSCRSGWVPSTPESDEPMTMPAPVASSSSQARSAPIIEMFHCGSEPGARPRPVDRGLLHGQWAQALVDQHPVHVLARAQPLPYGRSGVHEQAVDQVVRGVVQPPPVEFARAAGPGCAPRGQPAARTWCAAAPTGPRSGPAPTGRPGRPGRRRAGHRTDRGGPPGRTRRPRRRPGPAPRPRAATPSSHRRGLRAAHRTPPTTSAISVPSAAAMSAHRRDVVQPEEQRRLLGVDEGQRADRRRADEQTDRQATRPRLDRAGERGGARSRGRSP